jgi:ferredoxin-type protein NapH
MNAKKTRRTIVYIMSYLFPILFLFLSPIIPFEGIFDGTTKGIVNGSLVVFSFQFLFAIIFGRAFCGWICPGGGFQEVVCRYANDNIVKGKNAAKIKFVIWGIWLAAIFAGFISVGGVGKIDFLYNTYFSKPIQYWAGWGIIYLIVSSIIMLTSFIVGRRGFCHSLCWMSPFMIIGNRVGRALKAPQLKLKTVQSKCIDCGLCTKACQMSIDVMKLVKNGEIVHDECIKCNSCADVCPKKAIEMKMG